MAFTPSQPHQAHPTWGQGYGLLSFQVTGVLVASALNPFVSIAGGIISSIAMTILSSLFYVILAESKVPGALSDRIFRVRIALRAALLFSALSVVMTGVYDGGRLIESGRVGLHGALIIFAILVSYLAMWIGLELGSWLVHRKRLQDRGS